jgi:hypothetical protein
MFSISRVTHVLLPLKITVFSFFGSCEYFPGFYFRRFSVR